MLTDASFIAWLLVVPLAGGMGLAFVNRGSDGSVRIGALILSLATLAISLLMAMNFAWTQTPHMQFTNSVPWIASFGLTFSYGVDAISMWLILLTTFLMPLVILGAFADIRSRQKEFYLWLLLLEAAMLGVFVARDIIFFYICFEFTLVPLFFLIGIFGGAQRLKAAKIFFLYTFTGSMLTFAGVLYVAKWHADHFGFWTFLIDDLIRAATSAETGLSGTQQTWILLAMLAGFAVKVPLFPLHTWLPLAHTEAPTSGSVILAGVLLKLGTYALLRLAIPLTPQAAVDLAPAIAILAIVGILYTALICWVQKDIKKLIAYSSVSHLGFCVLGMFAMNQIGMSGSVLYMINHGLSTGALFLCVGMIYERLHTRQMAELGGLGKVMPVWSSFMVFFCLASVGLPGLNGFVSEFLTLAGAFTATDLLGPRYAVFAGVGMIFGAMYILYMVGKVVWGPVKLPGNHGDDHGHGHGGHGIADLNAREIVVLLPLAVACLALGLYPKPVLDSLHGPLENIRPRIETIAASPTEGPGSTLAFDTKPTAPNLGPQ